MKSKKADTIHIDINSHNGKDYHMSGDGVKASEARRFVKASYDETKDAEKDIGGYILDDKLSDKETKVYHDPKTGKTVVVNRGTKGAADWMNNARYGADVLTGNYFNLYNKSDRFQNAKNTQKKAIEKYGKVDTNLGHSQAGIITRKLNKRGLTDDVVNINPATFYDKPKKNETNLRSTYDPVSMFNRGATTIKHDVFNPLKAHSTDFLRHLGDTVVGHGINDMDELKRFIIGFKDKKSINGQGMEHKILDRIVDLSHRIHKHRGKINKGSIIEAYKMLGRGIVKSLDSDNEDVDSDEGTDSESDDDEHMEGGRISRSKKFNKWMKNLGGVAKSVGDYIKPIAKPIFKAGTDMAVRRIAGYGMEGGKISRSKKFNKWMKNLGGVTKSVGDYIAPVAKPIFKAGTDMAVRRIAGYGMDGCGMDAPKRRGRPPKGTITTMPVLTGRKPRMSPPDYAGAGFIDDVIKAAKTPTGKKVTKAVGEYALKKIRGHGFIDDVVKAAKTPTGKKVTKAVGDYALKKITGKGTGRMVKGSPEAKAFGERMKALRASKRG